MDFDKVICRKNTASIKWKRYPEDVIPMWVADMDFAAPECVQRAIKEVTDHAVYGYSVPGKDLIAAVCKYLKKSYDWEVAASSIVWLPGVVSALNIACRAYTKNGDDIMTAKPIYAPFMEAPLNAGRSIKAVALKESAQAYEMDFDAMKKAVSPKTKLYLLCNPHNPVGRVYSQQELRKLAAFCADNDMVICSDEIHCDLILDLQKKHFPIASLSKEIEKRCITLMAPSKTYNLAGLGFAFAVIPNWKLRKKFIRTMRGIVPYPNQIGLRAGQAAYVEGESWRLELVEYLRGNRQLIDEYLKENIAKIKYRPGEASYLAWLDVRQLKLENPFDFFLKNGVAFSKGEEFHCKGFLRMNFGCSRSVLKTALQRMKSAVQSIR